MNRASVLMLLLYKRITRVVLGSALLLAFATPFASADAAQLSISPPAGTFSVGSTFDVPVFLDTEGKTVNAFNIAIKFPNDKLQIISPSAGESVISVWTAAPKYDNKAGLVLLEGGVPGGVNVSQGLITTLTFRVKQVGTAVVDFRDDTGVYLHDGNGTPVLERTNSGVYTLVLPPPAGPIVVSETHPDQSAWFPYRTAVLQWGANTSAESYSYVLNKDPVSIPDIISEGGEENVAYRDLASGTHYFHIRAQRGGAWGGTTHFALQIDADPPASFPIEVSPSVRTTSKRPIISFRTTDEHSGMSHYEYRIIPLDAKNPSEEPFFIEAPERQQVLDLGLGSYDVIVRAYDNAGNVREEVQEIHIVTPIFQFVSSKGLHFGGATLAWIWVFILGVLLAGGLGFAAWKTRAWHHAVAATRSAGDLPEKTRKELDELKAYRKKYGKLVLLLAFFAPFFGGGIEVANAQQQALLAPPFVSTFSQNISNEEIFYIGGRTDAANAEVVIYLQNLQTGETFSNVVTADNGNEWFYRHDSFLSAGRYLLWTQSRVGEELSPPSPQQTLIVRQTAIQFGSSRLSFEVLYLMAALALLVLLLGLGGYMGYHIHHGRKQHRAFIKELREAEESVRRGFAVLRRDIEAELEIVRKAKKSKELSDEEKEREETLLKDLAWAEQYIGKEVWDIERTDHHH